MFSSIYKSSVAAMLFSNMKNLRCLLTQYCCQHDYTDKRVLYFNLNHQVKLSLKDVQHVPPFELKNF